MKYVSESNRKFIFKESKLEVKLSDQLELAFSILTAGNYMPPSLFV